MYENNSSNNLNPYLRKSIENQKVTHTGFLERIEHTYRSGGIRSKEIYGHFSLPVTTQPFVMITDPYNTSLPKESYLRLIKTSEVLEMLPLNTTTIQFKNLNSIYILKSIQRIPFVYSH